MCEEWIKESKGAINWTRLATNKEHKTARPVQEQQSAASGVLLGELHAGARKAVLWRIFRLLAVKAILL
jgi:hypothetical protein